MNLSKQQLVQSARLGTLVTLVLGQLTGTAALASDFQPDQVVLSNARSAGLTAKAIPISEADADAIENWLVGSVTRFNNVEISDYFFGQAEIVLAEPNAKTELAKIVARKDLPPHLRVYAQEMLMKAGQPRNPDLVEDYCYTLQNSRQIRLGHDIWGFPGANIGAFGRTLISYGQPALPCLSRLLNSENYRAYRLYPFPSPPFRDYTLSYASGEALGNQIADLAAYFITQILDLPYNNDSDLDARDKQIQDLRRRLGVPSKAGENEAAPIRFSTGTAIDELIFSRKNSPRYQWSCEFDAQLYAPLKR